jgi:type II secretory pathway component GspD/PulD (secretin)
MALAVNQIFRLLRRQLWLLLIPLLVLLPPGLSRAQEKTTSPGGRIIVCMIQLEHADAEHLASVLQPLLSPEGTITPHGPTNTLIIKDRAPVVNMLSEIIKGKPCVPVSEQPKAATGSPQKEGYLDR